MKLNLVIVFVVHRNILQKKLTIEFVRYYIEEWKDKGPAATNGRVHVEGFCGFVTALIREDVILEPEGCASFREAAMGCCGR